MEVLEAFDLTGSLRDAGELAGCSHHTVARYVAARELSAKIRGASKVLVVDKVASRLKLAEELGAITIDFTATDPIEAVQEQTDGGADKGIDAVGYQFAAGHRADDAADYHLPQCASFAAAGVDVVHAMTLSEPAEAIGVVRAARQAGLPVGVSFTVETDGSLPDGTTLGDAVRQVDDVAPPDWHGVNCAHPTHVRPALDGGSWQQRLRVLRPNASTMTHEELDAMQELDEGDRELLTSSTSTLLELLPSVTTLGGCCGTDVSHVASLWAHESRIQRS